MITEYIIKTLKQNKILDSKDEAIVQYGLNGLLSTMFSFLTIFLIGLCCNCLMESIIFTISFFFLRIYAGGYHANTPLKCYGISLAISIILFAIIHNINLHVWFLHTLFICSIIIIFKFAPIGTANKSLDSLEIIFFRKKTLNLLIIHIIVYVISSLLFNYKILWSLSISLTVTMILLIISKIK